MRGKMRDMKTPDAHIFENIAPLDPNTTMARAYLLMEKHQSPNLPIHSADQVVGIICERDIETLIKNHQSLYAPGDRKVANFMRSPVKSAEVDADLGSVAQLMLDERINAIVIKKGSDIIGALTRDDMLEVLVDILKNDRRSLLDSLGSINTAYRKRSSQASSDKLL